MSYLGYAGDLSPSESYELVKANNGVIIDVRTQAEWSFVGVPLVESLLLIEWQSYPAMGHNEQFIESVKQKVRDAGGSNETPLYFLCRSGARSKSAAIALTQAGFTSCFNISDGFEGPPDQAGHRGLKAGWKSEKLPWRQN